MYSHPALILFLAGAISALSIPSRPRALFDSLPLDSPEPLSPEVPPALRRRDDTPLDLSTIPTHQCDVPEGVIQPYCTQQPPDFVDCPLVPCNNGSHDCQSYSRDCFCDKPTPLRCAWSCDWRGWMYVEDWFSQTCPDVPPVDFSPLPSCARKCIERSSIYYGCVSQSRNCFCLEGNLFNCTNGCGKESDIHQIADWYSKLCSLSSEASFTAVSTENGSFLFNGSESGHKQAILIELPSSRILHWYEILVIFTAVLTFIVGCMWALALYVFERTWGLTKEELQQRESRKLAAIQAKAEAKARQDHEKGKAQEPKEKPIREGDMESPGEAGRGMEAQGEETKGGEGVEETSGEKEQGSVQEGPSGENIDGEPEETKIGGKDGIFAKEEPLEPEDDAPKTRWKKFSDRYFDFSARHPGGRDPAPRRKWRHYLGLG